MKVIVLNMKKVLMIHHSGSIGGASLSLVHLSLAMKQLSNEYSYTVYCPNQPPKVSQLLQSNCIKVIEYEHTPLIFDHYSGAKKSIFSLRAWTNIWNVIKKRSWDEIKVIIQKEQPDIVMINSMTLVWLGPMLKKENVETICFHRETYINEIFNFRTNYIKKNIKKYFDKIVFISQYDCDETGVVNGKKMIITDKVKLEDYHFSVRENVFHNDRFKILYMGGFSKLKGAHVILKAIKLLRKYEKNINLILLGYNRNKVNEKKLRYKLSYEGRMLNYIKRNKLENSITYVDYTTEPEKYLLESDLVVFPSVFPHQARPLYEAGAAQKPIIITNFKETSEFAIDKFNCLTFKRGNAADLTKQILSIMNDQLLVDQLVKNNYTLTNEQHNFNDLSNQLKELLKI